MGLGSSLARLLLKGWVTSSNSGALSSLGRCCPLEWPRNSLSSKPLCQQGRGLCPLIKHVHELRGTFEVVNTLCSD